MNPDLSRLQAYPFEKLAALLRDASSPAARMHINLSIGEPKHATPQFITEALIQHLQGMASYPTTKGLSLLRTAIADWLTQRFGLRAGSLDPEHNVLPVNGTREALFAFAQCVIDRSRTPLLVMPNPFYQIYEGAALLAGAEPYFLNNTAAHDFVPDYDAVPARVWQRCQLLYLCSPDNPTGAVTDRAVLQKLIGLADQYDFIIAADECYSEIYSEEDAPPEGLLGAAAAMGRDDFRRCVVFHSLSKRSNVPGLRSGFVAGDAAILKQFLLYRTYHGCAMPPATQHASAAAWRDEQHVRDNRALYREKFTAVLAILAPRLDVQMPAAGFYLWPRTPIDDAEFARRLFAEYQVTVLPGSFLSRSVHGVNPGQNRVRIALVPPLADCVAAAERIRSLLDAL